MNIAITNANAPDACSNGSSNDLPIGTIPVDSKFTPTRKVNFNVEPTHVGQETSRERLTLDVWTDGTISPTDAIGQAANILVEQLSPFVDFPRIAQLAGDEDGAPAAVPDERYATSMEHLDLSVRTMNCLRRAGITTVGELLSKGEKEMMSLRNFGQKSKQFLGRLNTPDGITGIIFASNPVPSEIR